MLKISGAFLCIAGCAGYGFLKIKGWKEELKALQQWIFLFQKIKSRIFYQKEPLEESCIWIGEKEKGDLERRNRGMGEAEQAVKKSAGDSAAISRICKRSR